MTARKRISAYTQTLNEQQKLATPEQEQQPIQTGEELVNTVLSQDSNTVLSQNDNTPSKQNPNEEISQSDNKVLIESHKDKISQGDNIVISQNNNVTPAQKERMTDKRERMTYYLNPGQLDKLEDLRIKYKRATGKRINEQDLMRMVIDRLTLDFLL